jgi:protein-S-isoprenylcysteine O-methyltransferase Ste14
LRIGGKGMIEETKTAVSEEIDMKALKKTAIIRSLSMLIVLGLTFFLTAWTLMYWEGWAYIFVLGIPMFIFGMYLFKHDPKLLERRMRTKEKHKEQKLVIKLSFLSLPLNFILPGLDKRFDWSKVPIMIEIIAFVLVLIGYVMTISVLKANSYASRIVEVEKGQKVISNGPYAIVRHPMYSSIIILYLSSPIALGSYWTLIPTFIYLIILIFRIFGEEKVLLEELEGYREYTKKVKYRLIPGIW